MTERKIYTKTECYNIAKKYRNRSDFRVKDWSAYIQSKNNGWLDEISPSTIPPLTYEKCYDVASKYIDYSTFRENECSVYGKSIKTGWIKSFTWLKKRSRDLDAKINYVYAYEFESLKSVYIGRTMSLATRKRNHLKDKKDSVYKFITENELNDNDYDFILLKEKLTVKESQYFECEYIQKYKNDGWSLINRVKGGSIGSPIIKWDYDKCMEIARSYSYLKDLSTDYPGVYEKARKMGWLKEYTWLEYFKPKEIYTYEECYEKAKKYKTHNQFYVNDKAYVTFAKRKNWYKDYTWLKNKEHDSIIEYDLHGHFIALHTNILNEFGNVSGIFNCANGRIKSSNNRIWRYKEDVTDTDGNILNYIDVNITPSYYRPVVQYTKSGDFIKEYPTLKSTGFCSSSILDALKGIKTIYSHGYLWKYKDEVLDVNGTILQHIEPRTNKNNKSIILYMTNGDYVREYKTQTAAIKDGFKRSHIEWVSNHKYTTIEGLLKYKALWVKKSELIEKYGEVPIKIDPLSLI